MQPFHFLLSSNDPGSIAPRPGAIGQDYPLPLTGSLTQTKGQVHVPRPDTPRNPFRRLLQCRNGVAVLEVRGPSPAHMAFRTFGRGDGHS